MRLFSWVDADGVWRVGRADQLPGDVSVEPWERFDDQVVKADAEVRQAVTIQAMLELGVR